jgi:anaerobic ribonucleoside-triphosphate reductase activating protein
MIRYSHITLGSMVDGPGQRTVLFCVGCTVRCPGCQNPHLWTSNGGMITTEEQLAAFLISLSPHGNISLSGGEILDQPDATLALLTYLRQINPDVHVILYTGRTYEQLSLRLGPLFRSILEKIDVLVDGPFVHELDDSLITWRGSRNQRPIDVKATLVSGQVVVLDWDEPEIQIDKSGGLHLPIGLAQDFAEIGEVKRSRMCGQAKTKPEAP